MRKIEIRLKQILDSRNMMQKDLAALTEIRPNTVSDYYHGHLKTVKLEHLAKIMDVLEIDDIRKLLVVVDED